MIERGGTTPGESLLSKGVTMAGCFLVATTSDMAVLARSVWDTADARIAACELFICLPTSSPTFWF
jgi:hypothetical protein